MASTTVFPVLYRYLGWRFAQTIFLTALGLAVFILLLDVVELVRRLSSTTDGTAALAFQLALLKLPDMLQQLAPFILLIGTLLCFTKLSRDRELIAVRGAGLPARLFLMPAILVCLGIGGLNVLVLNPIAATALKSYERQEMQLFPDSAQGLVSAGGEIWLRQQTANATVFLYAQRVSPGGNALSGISLFIFDHQGRFSTRWQASTMAFQDGHWQLTAATRLSATQGPTKIGNAVLNVSLTPDMIQNSLTSPQTQSVWELRMFVQHLKTAGLASTKYELYYHKLLASPLLLLAMVLLAAPFALHYSRTMGTSRLLVIGLGMGFGFYVFSNVIATYGLAGRLPPMVAAWAPAVVAFLIGGGFFLHFREE